VGYIIEQTPLTKDGLVQLKSLKHSYVRGFRVVRELGKVTARRDQCTIRDPPCALEANVVVEELEDFLGFSSVRHLVGVP
jgi:hypothetical protein